MKFWDASAIVPLCITQPLTEVLHGIAREDNSIVVWWGSVIECRSAFARLWRDGFLSSKEEEDVRATLSLLSSAWVEMKPCEEIREITGRLLLNHPLRAADSLQLAAAISWTDKKPNGHSFVCLDLKLGEAARREGFTILPIKFQTNQRNKRDTQPIK